MKKFPGVTSRWTMPARVRRRQAGRDLSRNIDRVVKGDRTSSESIAKCLAFVVRHGYEAPSVRLADLVDRGDVRMVQCGRRLGFRQQLVGLGARRLGEEFQGGQASEAMIVSRVDNPHAAASELSDNLEVSDPIPCRKRSALARRVDNEVSDRVESSVEQRVRVRIAVEHSAQQRCVLGSLAVQPFQERRPISGRALSGEAEDASPGWMDAAYQVCRMVTMAFASSDPVCCALHCS